MCARSLTCVSVCSSDVFKLDPDFLENEEKYKTIKRGETEWKQLALSVSGQLAPFTV